MTGRICKHEDCGRPVAGRGMCKTHYNRWLYNNPHLTIIVTNRQAVLDAMPATIPKLIEKTGMTRAAVLGHLAVLNAANNRKAYIYDWEAPSGRGKNWQPIYREGGHPNKRLTPERKHQHNRAMDNASNARRTGAKRKITPASWAAALMLEAA